MINHDYNNLNICTSKLIMFLGTADGCKFISEDPKYMDAIVELAWDASQPAIMKDALLALVNLSTVPSIAIQLSKDSSIVEKLISLVLDRNFQHADIVCSILSNVTRNEEAAKVVVDIIASNQEEIGLEKLVTALCTIDFNKNAKLHFLASVISNLTQQPQARMFVLNKSQCVVQRLLPFVDYRDSVIRRGGVIATLHNCCFETGGYKI